MPHLSRPELYHIHKIRVRRNAGIDSAGFYGTAIGRATKRLLRVRRQAEYGLQHQGTGPLLKDAQAIAGAWQAGTNCRDTMTELTLNRRGEVQRKWWTTEEEEPIGEVGRRDAEHNNVTHPLNPGYGSLNGRR